MDDLLQLDEQLFLFLNQFHERWLDPVMALLTKTEVWIPLYLILIFLIVKDYKKESVFIILGLIVCIIITDQITSGLMKPYFERLRPSHEPSLANLIHLVNDEKGGLYGFASSHASNTFGMATFIWLSLQGKYKKVIWIFAWAGVMSYSRIYLGLHYPGDIFVGAIIGFTVAWLIYKVTTAILDKRKKKLTY